MESESSSDSNHHDSDSDSNHHDSDSDSNHHNSDSDSNHHDSDSDSNHHDSDSDSNHHNSDFDSDSTVNELQMIPTPIQTPESESESLFDSDSVVRIATSLFNSEAVHSEANYILVSYTWTTLQYEKMQNESVFCGMGLPNLMLCIIAIVVAAIVVGDNYIFHVRRN